MEIVEFKMKYKALIFDVDGTLAETEELHREAFNLTFKKLHLNWYWDVDIYKELLKVSGGKERLIFYNHYFQTKTEAIDKKKLLLIHHEKTIIYTKTLQKKKLQLRPGVADLIKQAQEKKMKLAIATATSLKNVDSLINNIWGTPNNKIFQVIGSSDDVSKKKPSPEVYELVLDRLQLEPQHCIAIEDSLNGLRSARSAGLKTIVNPSLYTKNDDFQLADVVVPSLVGFKL